MWPTLGNAKFGLITEVAASGGKLSITIQGLIIQVASAYEGWSLVRVVQFLTLRFYSVHTPGAWPSKITHPAVGP